MDYKEVLKKIGISSDREEKFKFMIKYKCPDGMTPDGMLKDFLRNLRYAGEFPFNKEVVTKKENGIDYYRWKPLKDNNREWIVGVNHNKAKERTLNTASVVWMFWRENGHLPDMEEFNDFTVNEKPLHYKELLESIIVFL
jgi:hypothetical protein